MDILIGILNVLIVLGSLFLICIILIQRGKGGGLAGAFGGVGGSSAFGTKAGDVFTKITIGVAIGWILVAMLLVKLSNGRAGSRSDWGTDTVSASKDLSSSSKSKSKSDGLDTGLGAGDVPPPVPTPAKDLGTPPSALPVQKTAPSSATPAPSATTKTPAVTPPAPSTATPAPSTATPGKASPKP